MVNVDYVAPSRTTTIRVEHRPVYSALESLSSLSIVEQFPGMSAWTLETARSLSEAQRHTHDLVFGPLHDAVFPFDVDSATASFPAYLETLDAADPAVMRDRLLRQLCRREVSDGEQPDPAVLLADRQAYLAHIEHLYQWKDKLDHFDRALYEEAHALLNDPPAMKQLVVSHLRAMWDEHLAPEWARVEPMLRESAAAFQKLDLSGRSVPDVFQIVTGRSLPDAWAESIAGADSIVFVPSAHIGPYLGMVEHDNQAWVMFGARVPEGAQMSSSAFSRSELLVRLSALADDTRLQILQLVGDEGELCAQAIIERLDLSQSAASRHLRQLTATGFLLERRKDGAKCYRLNRERVGEINRALSQFLG